MQYTDKLIIVSYKKLLMVAGAYVLSCFLSFYQRLLVLKAQIQLAPN